MSNIKKFRIKYFKDKNAILKLDKILPNLGGDLVFINYDKQAGNNCAV